MFRIIPPHPFYQLLCIDVQKRISCLAELQKLDLVSEVNWDAVLTKNLPPGFIPNVSMCSSLPSGGWLEATKPSGHCCSCKVERGDAEEQLATTTTSLLIHTYGVRHAPSFNTALKLGVTLVGEEKKQVFSGHAFCSLINSARCSLFMNYFILWVHLNRRVFFTTQCVVK